MLTRQLDITLVKAIASFPGKLALVSSFGPTSMVIIDRLDKLNLLSQVPVISIDTGELFTETYALLKQVETRYGIKVQVVKAILPTPGLWRTDPTACCQQRKVEPLALALQGFDAWITGLRRDQASTRTDQAMISYDATGHTKIAPMIEWTREATWTYLRANNVPYNALHDAGFGSIGCTHCTRQSKPGDERGGRFVGQGRAECGIHLQAVTV